MTTHFSNAHTLWCPRPDRIPFYTGDPVQWALDLHAAGLSYHIDDDPRTVVCSLDGTRTFSDEEAEELDRITEALTGEQREEFFVATMDEYRAQQAYFKIMDPPEEDPREPFENRPPLPTIDPTKNTLGLILIHGRNTPDEAMDDWGFDGPILRLTWLHVTYESHFKVGFNNDWLADLQFVNGCVHYDGKFYGDFSLFPLAGLTTSDRARIQDPVADKFHPPTPPRAPAGTRPGWCSWLDRRPVSLNFPPQ